jgi:hypothetical protein
LLTTHRAVLTLAIALAAAPALARGATLWTAAATEKIRADAAARPEATTAQLSAARNEFEAFQIVVTGPASGVSVTGAQLQGPGTIPAPKLFREDFIDVQRPSSVDGGTGRYPDALVPDVDDVVGEKRNAFPFDVSGGESRAVWVEFHVPPDAAPGAYQGAVTVHFDGGDHAVPVQLTVWGFGLPSTASLKTAFTMTASALQRQHGASGEALTALRQRYAQLALDHRISISNFWDDGNRDWSHIDNAYGPFLDGTASTQLAGAQMTSVQSGADLDSAAQHAEWAAHFREHGWFDRLFQYTCDEPPLTCNWSDIPSRAQAAKQGDPEFRTLVTTDLDQATQNGVLDAIDVMVPVVNFVDDRPVSDLGWTDGGDKSPDYARFAKSAPRKELWLYQSCMSHGCGGTVDIGNPSAEQRYYTGWPSYEIDASATRNRAMEWLSFRYGSTGELYYEMAQAYFNGDPWTDAWAFNGNGDGTFFYPGTPARIGGSTDIPVASLRMKMIREGMEDYEYLKLLSDLGGGQDAQQIAQQLFPRAYQTDVSADALMSARAALAQKIMERGGGGAPPVAAHASAGGASSDAGGDASANPFLGGGGCGSAGAGSDLAALLLIPSAVLFRRRRRARA